MYVFWTFGEYAHTYTPKHYISTNPINVITRLCIHTWHSEPLGNSCYTCTPNIWYFIECECTLVKYHYKYVLRPIPKNICILICLAWNSFLKHATHHHHAIYALGLFSRFLCLQDFNLKTCFWCHKLQLIGLTLAMLGRLQPLDLTFGVHDFIIDECQILYICVP
jgi:hypothetical protein